jgi:hypothetical protein
MILKLLSPTSAPKTWGTSFCAISNKQVPTTMKNSISGISEYNNTSVFTDRNNNGHVMTRSCKLYDTIIVTVNYGDGKLSLCHGGHDTKTTKKRMNEFLNANDLSYHVKQVDGDWYLYDDDEVVGEFITNSIIIDL